MSTAYYRTYNGETELEGIVENSQKPVALIPDIQIFIDRLNEVLSYSKLTSNTLRGLRYIDGDVLNNLFDGRFDTRGISVVQKFVPMKNGTKRSGTSAPFVVNYIDRRNISNTFMNEVFGFCPENVESDYVYANRKTPENLWSNESINEEINEKDADMLFNILMQFINSSNPKCPNGNIVIRLPKEMDNKESALYGIKLLKDLLSLVPPIYRNRINFSSGAEIDYATIKNPLEEVVRLDGLTNIMVVSNNSKINMMPGFDKKIISSADRMEVTLEFEWLYKWIKMSSKERSKLCNEFKIGKNSKDIYSLYNVLSKSLLLNEKMKSLNSQEHNKLMQFLNSYDEDEQKCKEASSNLRKLKKDKNRYNEESERYSDLESLRKMALNIYQSGNIERLLKFDLTKFEFNISYTLKQLIVLERELSYIKSKMSIFHLKERRKQINEKQEMINTKKQCLERALNKSFDENIEESSLKAKNCVKRIIIIDDKLKMLKEKLNVDIINIYNLLKSKPELLSLVSELKGIDFNNALNGFYKEEIIVIEDGKPK